MSDQPQTTRKPFSEDDVKLMDAALSASTKVVHEGESQTTPDYSGLIARLRQKARYCRNGSKDADAHGAYDSACVLRREATDLDEAADLIEATKADAGPETPQQWRNQLLRELANVVIEMAPPDGQKRIGRILRALDASLQREGGERER